VVDILGSVIFAIIVIGVIVFIIVRARRRNAYYATVTPTTITISARTLRSLVVFSSRCLSFSYFILF